MGGLGHETSSGSASGWRRRTENPGPLSLLVPLPIKAPQLKIGQRVEGHFFGRGFRGVIDGVYTVPAQGLREIHVSLEASIKVAGKKLDSVCLWLTPGCEMYSADGKALIGAITTVYI